MTANKNNGARDPMGLDELTSHKWPGIGTGQIRI
jgi:gamma-glutamyl phosphate reductase